MRLFGHEWTFRKTKNDHNFLEMTIDEEAEEMNLFVYAYALHIITDLIASIVSNTEFKTYGEDAKEVKGLTWVKLNMRPNLNQTGTEFIQEAIKKLLINGECLIVQVKDSFYVADDYTVDSKTIRGNVFTNVRKDDYTFHDKFKAEEVVYLRYSDRKARAIVHYIVDTYDKLINTARNKYERTGEEKGILTIDQQERNRPDYEETMEKIVNERFKKFFSRGNRVLPLFNGYKYDSMTSENTKKYSNEVSDIKTLFEEAIARVAQAFKVPIGLIRGDVAGINDAYTMLLTNCIDPLAAMLSEAFTTAMYSDDKIVKGYSIEADTSNIKHVDIFDLAGPIDKLIASGFLSIDEARVKSGLRQLNEEWSQCHYMTLNYTTAEAAVQTGQERSEKTNSTWRKNNDEGSEEE